MKTSTSLSKKINLLVVAAFAILLVSPGSITTIAANHKVTICHVPPGNPEKRQTLEVSVNALDAHLAHGDFVGSCDSGIDHEVDTNWPR